MASDYSKLGDCVLLERILRVQIEGCNFENNFDVAAFRYTGITLDNTSLFMQQSGFNRNTSHLNSTTDDRWGDATKCPVYDLGFKRANRFKNLSKVSSSFFRKVRHL